MPTLLVRTVENRFAEDRAPGTRTLFVDTVFDDWDCNEAADMHDLSEKK